MIDFDLKFYAFLGGFAAPRRGAAAGRRWPPWWPFLCITALARYAHAPPTRITDLTDIEHFCITALYRSALYHLWGKPILGKAEEKIIGVGNLLFRVRH